MVRLLTLLFLLFAIGASAQEDRYIKEGNVLFMQKKYAEAEVAYKNALIENPNSAEAFFNLGTIYLKQDSTSKAIEFLQKASNLSQDAKIKGMAYHNIGNAYMHKKEYQQAIDAYQNSLAQSPNDEDTKFNLAMASGFSKNEQQRKDPEKQRPKDNNPDPNQKNDANSSGGSNQLPDNANTQQSNKGGKEGQFGDNLNGDLSKSDEEINKNIKPKEGQMSKEQAKRLLETLQNEEKRVQKKVLSEKNGRQQRRVIDKDW
ncbi:MAG: tetratricopeptide repeat protein [Chitinophagales bacterium]|nr:tetratricopeptide repeat protein [Chitinophagales bacterium]